MKVEYHSSAKVCFSALTRGDVFAFEDCIYMKMGDVCGYNAVDLDNGSVDAIDNDELVRVVEAKVVCEE